MVGVEGKPQRVVPYDISASEKNYKNSTIQNKKMSDTTAAATTTTAAVAAAYRTWTPILQALYDTWGQDMKDRPVLVVVPNAYTLEAIELKDTVLVQAWERILLQTVGVPAVCFQPVLTMLPMAWPALSTMLCVYVSTTVAATFIHAHGQSLPFTLYTVPRHHHTGMVTEHEDDNDNTQNEEESWPWITSTLPLTHPGNLITAVLQTLLACPMTQRTTAVHNIMVCGDGVVSPDLPVLLGRRIQEILTVGTKDNDMDEETTVSTSAPTPMTTTTSSSSTSSQNYQMMRTSMVSVDIATLQPLATHVGILDTMSDTQADLWPWYGATLYAATQGEALSWTTTPAASQEG
jgi:hypothetical protein